MPANSRWDLIRRLRVNNIIRNNVGPKEEGIVGIKCFIAVYIAHILFVFWRNRPPSGPGSPRSRGF